MNEGGELRTKQTEHPGHDDASTECDYAPFDYSGPKWMSLSELYQTVLEPIPSRQFPARRDKERFNLIVPNEGRTDKPLPGLIGQDGSACLHGFAVGVVSPGHPSVEPLDLLRPEARGSQHTLEVNTMTKRFSGNHLTTGEGLTSQPE